MANEAKRKESRGHWQRLFSLLSDIHAEIEPRRLALAASVE
jgi:hypothetical protein